MRYQICSAWITITAGMLLGSGAALAASNACKADLNGDLVVNFGDLAVLKSVFFQRCNDPGPTCGDGVAQGPTEQCDDGNVLNGDGCSETCTIEGPIVAVCGDGFADRPEQCDDHNLTNGDGCSATCTLEPARHFPATGQTTCWDSWRSPIPCTGTGQDGEIQAGATLAYMDNGDGTITDLNTGLMWEKLSLDGTIHDMWNFYTWRDAVAVKIAGLNAGSGFAGHKDWRLPNVKELDSIVDYGTSVSPTVAAAFNTGCTRGCTVTTCSCTWSCFYWSSTWSQDFPIATSPFSVSFGATLSCLLDESDNHYVRAVRGGSD